VLGVRLNPTGELESCGIGILPVPGKQQARRLPYKAYGKLG